MEGVVDRESYSLESESESNREKSGRQRGSLSRSIGILVVAVIRPRPART